MTLNFLLFYALMLVLTISCSESIKKSEDDKISGDVSGIWTIESSPYSISGDITVPAGETLTIEPGVTIIFQGSYQLNVQGNIIADGNETDSIFFTAENRNVGWNGMKFINTQVTNDSSIISYSKINYGNVNGDTDDTKRGGAIYIKDYSNLIIRNSLIENNYANSGGGIACWNANPKIINNKIRNNTSVYGGGILCFNSSPEIIGNIVVNNTTDITGGGIYCHHNCTPRIINNFISTNSAGQMGGGMYCVSSLPIVLNNTFTNNSADKGGGITFEADVSPDIINTIIWDNSATYGDQIFIIGNDTDPNFYFCDIQGDTIDFEFQSGETYEGNFENNINIDPLLLIKGNYQFVLSNSSPCIDKGKPDVSGLNLPFYDLIGNTRIYNNRIDIGAYEYNGN